jgi:tetratricopeptide (TPR) repeat protein
MHKLFLTEVLNLCGTYCGEQYLKEIDTIRLERERILNGYWREVTFPESISIAQQAQLFRDIDFDTMVFYAHKYLDESHYVNLLSALTNVCLTHGELARGYTLLVAITEKYRQWTDSNSLALAYYKMGNINFLRNDYPKAEKEFLKSLEVVQKENNPQLLAMLANARGILKVNANQIDEGIKFLEEGLEAGKRIADDEIIANANMNLGNTYHLRGEWDTAMKHYQEALKFFSKLNRKDKLANINLNLAIAYKFQNDLAQTESYLRTAMAIAQETNNRYQKGLGYLLDAELALLKNDHSSAVAFVTSAFAIFTEVGDRLSVAEAYKILGMINCSAREYAVAHSFFESSRRINEMCGNYSNLAEVLVELGKLYEVTNELEHAMDSYRKAIENLQIIGAKARIKNIEALLSKIA